MKHEQRQVPIHSKHPRLSTVSTVCCAIGLSATTSVLITHEEAARFAVRRLGQHKFDASNLNVRDSSRIESRTPHTASFQKMEAVRRTSVRTSTAPLAVALPRLFRAGCSFACFLPTTRSGMLRISMLRARREFLLRLATAFEDAKLHISNDHK